MVMLDRYADSAPWFAGDRILMRYPNQRHYGACTAGFGATYNATEVMVTAGHCAPYGATATPTSVTNGSAYRENGCPNVNGCDHGAFGSFGTVWQTRLRTYDTIAQATAGPLSTDLALVRTDTLPTTHAAGSAVNLTSLVSFPGATREPTGSACHSGATSLGYCGFTIEANIRAVIADAQPGYARIQIWRAVRNASTFRVCEGDSGGTVYQHFGSGEMILGVVSGGWGPEAPSTKGAECFGHLGFVYWGQGRGVFPGYTPLV
jgi:hypothetical protein